MHRYINNGSKGCVLEIDLKYSKELRELEIKREMLSKYRLKIADLHNILIGCVKKLVRNSFDKEKYVVHYENLQLYFRLGLKLKKFIMY